METARNLIALFYGAKLSIINDATDNLIKIKDPRTVDPLIKGLKNHRDPFVRRNAVKILGGIAVVLVNKDDLTIIETKALDKIIDALIFVVKNDLDQSKLIKKEAIYWLGEIGVSRIAPFLIEIIDLGFQNGWDKDYWLVDLLIQSMYALGKIGEVSPEAENLLTLALKSDNDYLRWAAVWASGEIGNSQHAELLIRIFLNDKEWRAQDTAAASLGKIGNGLGEGNKALLSRIIKVLTQAIFFPRAMAPESGRERAGDGLRSIGFDVVLDEQEFEKPVKYYTGLDGDFFKELKKSNPLKGLGDNNIGEDLYRLKQLHEKYGTSEPARYIFKQYNISFFGRYTVKVLSHL